MVGTGTKSKTGSAQMHSLHLGQARLQQRDEQVLQDMRHLPGACARHGTGCDRHLIDNTRTWFMNELAKAAGVEEHEELSDEALSQVKQDKLEDDIAS